MTVDLKAIANRASGALTLTLAPLFIIAVCWTAPAIGESSSPIVTTCPAPKANGWSTGPSVMRSDGEDVSRYIFYYKQPNDLIRGVVRIDPSAVGRYWDDETFQYELECPYSDHTKLTIPIPGLPISCDEILYEVDTVRADGSPFRDTRWISYACESEIFLPKKTPR